MQRHSFEETMTKAHPGGCAFFCLTGGEKAVYTDTRKPPHRRMVSQRSKDGMKDKLKAWAKKFKQNIAALYLAYKDPRTPKGAKVAAAVTVAYAISPIDLIPDFIPVLGYLDDMLLLPLFIWICLRMIPRELMEEFREKAQGLTIQNKTMQKIAMWAIIGFWAIIALRILLEILL